MKFKILTLFIIIFIIFYSCKKDKSLKNDIQNNNLEGSWQIVYMEDSVLYLGYPVLADMGFACNLFINDKGLIIVNDGDSQDKIAEWQITDISGTNINVGDITIELKMKKPEKLKYTYKYAVTLVEYYNNLYVFTPIVSDNSFVFFNNKNLGAGLPGSYVFYKSN
jgi:hypothetical protein